MSIDENQCPNCEHQTAGYSPALRGVGCLRCGWRSRVATDRTAHELHRAGKLAPYLACFGVRPEGKGRWEAKE